MSLFYSIDTDEVKDELDDLRIVIRPAEVSELLDLHPNTVYRLLQSGKYKVKDVVWMVGYTNASHFIDAFKKRYGVTPGEI